MVTLLLDQSRLEVVLSATERLLSFQKGNVAIERHTIVKVQLTDDAWTWLRGAPARATFLPGTVAMGTWKSASGEDFALIRRRRPGVVIDLDGHERFQRLIITTRHGVALVKALRAEVDGAATDVVDIVAASAEKKPRARTAPRPAPAT